MRLKFHLRSSGSNLQQTNSCDDSSCISLIKRVSSIQQDQPFVSSICSDAVYEPCETPCSSHIPASSEQRIDKRKYTEVETYIVSRTKDLLRNARMPPVTAQLAVTPVSSICNSKGSDDDGNNNNNSQAEPTKDNNNNNTMDSSDSSSEGDEDTADMEEARLADGIDVLRGLGKAVWKIFSPEVLTQNSSSP